jgi:hypothetical protein
MLPQVYKIIKVGKTTDGASNVSKLQPLKYLLTSTEMFIISVGATPM